MKTILMLSLLISGSALSAVHSLVIEKSSVAGKEQKAILFEEKEMMILKNSNIYDEKADYRLGKFQGKKTDELYITEARLKQISTALVAADKILQKKGSSFSKLHQNDNPHGDKIFLDRILVTENSAYYAELKKLISDLDTSDYTLVEGEQISKDKKKIETVKKGAIASKEDFLVPFFCNKPKFPARCELRNSGVLYVK